MSMLILLNRHLSEVEPLKSGVPQKILARSSHGVPVKNRKKKSHSKLFQQNIKVGLGDVSSKVATNKLRFHSYYSDRMVFQKEVKNNIWGYYDKEHLTAKYICM